MQLDARNPDTLKHLLEQDGQLPAGTDALALCLGLLDNFASTDANLRDTLSYSLLVSLLVKHRVLDVAGQRTVLERALDDEHLFWQIGDRGTNSVVMRGFSVLVVPLILDPDAEDPQLDPTLVHAAIERVLAYARTERDRRGYIEGIGWAHTVAHTADALDSCAQHPLATTAERVQVLDCFAALATLPDPLAFGEDDRLAFAASRLLEKNWVDSEVVDAWLHKFSPDQPGTEPERTIRKANADHFLRSLYFLLKWKQADPALIGKVEEQLRTHSWYVQEDAL